MYRTCSTASSNLSLPPPQCFFGPFYVCKFAARQREVLYSSRCIDNLFEYFSHLSRRRDSWGEGFTPGVSGRRSLIMIASTARLYKERDSFSSSSRVGQRGTTGCGERAERAKTAP